MEIIGIGEIEGDSCNRNGCCGEIIKDTDLESCSCHISPPCSYCCCDVKCSECNYSSYNERPEIIFSKDGYDFLDEIYKAREELNRKIKDESFEFDKVEWRSEGHSNSSMKKIGGFPRGMDKKDLINELNGTFGGRFERLTENRFIFIAYTD